MLKYALSVLVLAAAGLGLLSSCARSDSPAASPGNGQWLVTISPSNAFIFMFVKDGQCFGEASIGGWGPNWKWFPTSKPGLASNGVLDVTMPCMGTPANPGIVLNEHVVQSSPSSLTVKYTLNATSDQALEQLSDVFSFSRGVTGAIRLVHADGTSQTEPLPSRLRPDVDNVSEIDLSPAAVGDIKVAVNPPISIGFDHNMLRLFLAHVKFPAGTQAYTFTVSLPAPFRLADTQASLDALTKPIADSSWFPWQPANDVGPSEIGMESWLDAPAGSHGPVTIDGDQFKFADGTPVKFWGTNLCFQQVAPQKADAEFTAARFAKYGINCVRFQQFNNTGWQGIGSPQSSVEFDPKLLDRLDYFTAQLEKHGVYFGFSHWHYTVRPGDASSLLDYNELMQVSQGDTIGMINGAPDVQDCMIAMVVALLQHKNPYTGRTYAQDPALAWLEVQNEDDIFFYTFAAIDKYPHYKEAMEQRFGDWLMKKYGNQAALQASWGGALKSGEQVGGKVDFVTNPWQFSDDNLRNQPEGSGARQRLLDNAHFFYDEQIGYYNRFVAAVRAAGYKGPINGSPWWAPTTLPQYLNLLADAQTGYVDRHNYFQGVDPLFASQLSDPGSGIMNIGMLQTADHPFTLSEWGSVYPNVYSAESPAIMAAYGMGLQGWDASYEFESFSSSDEFVADAGHFPWNIWNVDVPNQIGQYPTLARMVYRGDVQTGAPVAVKRVSAEQLATGKFDFTDSASVSGDVKSFTGSVPQEAMAAGRTQVQFVDKTTPSTFPDMSKYESDKTIKSDTGQLQWNYDGKGYIKVATPGTVGIVGFAQGQTVTSAGVTLRLDSPFGSVFVTAMGPHKTLATCDKAIVTACGEEFNTGFTYFAPLLNTGFPYFSASETIVNNGTGPILIQGIKANLTIAGRPIAQVNVLDQDGRLQPGDALAAGAGGAIALDTARDKTIYYEIVFK